MEAARAGISLRFPMWKRARALVKGEALVPQGGHKAPGGRARLHAVGGVFHDKAFLRAAAEPRHGVEINFRVGLAGFKLLSADDDGEKLHQPALAQHLPDVAHGAGAGQRQLQAHGPQLLQHGAGFRAEDIGEVDGLVFVGLHQLFFKLRSKGHPAEPGHKAGVLLAGHAHGGVHALQSDPGVFCLQVAGLHPEVDGFAVDEHTVHIKDHGPDGGWHKNAPFRRRVHRGCS